MALSTSDPQYHGLARHEYITRLELQRKTLRDAARDTEAMIDELDAHLARVAAAKREWLRAQHVMAQQRAGVVSAETAARRVLEAAGLGGAERLYNVELAPHVRALQAAPSVPRHRRT